MGRRKHLGSLKSFHSSASQLPGAGILLLDFITSLVPIGAPLVAQMVKSLPAMWETQVWSLAWEDALEKEMATHSSVLAWRILWPEEPGGLWSIGSQRVRHDWATNTLSGLRNSHLVVTKSLTAVTSLFIDMSGDILFHRTHIVQFSSIAQSCPTLCDSMDYSMPGFPIHHQLLELTQTHVHWVSDAIQPSHLLSSPSPPTFNLSWHQGLFQWVSSLHQVAKALDFQVKHQSLQWIFRTDFL